MAGEGWEVDGTQVEEEMCDNAASDTLTEGEEGGDDGDETVVDDTEFDAAAGFVGNNYPVHMMEDGGEGDPPVSKEAPAAESCHAVRNDSGRKNYGGGNESTQPTQIDSPPAPGVTATPTGHRDQQDSDNTESQNPLSLQENEVASPSLGKAFARTEAGAVERRRTPSPPRRAGRGSGVFLSGGGAAASGDGGTSSGFLSSAGLSVTAARAASSSLSSSHPLPRGWLNNRLNATGATATDTANTEPQRPRRARQQPAVRRPIETADDGEVVAKALPQKNLLKKAATGHDGWMTKCSPFKGGNAPLPAATAVVSAVGREDNGQVNALGAQRGLVSPSIFAIGVPHERRVVGLPQSRRAGATAAAATAAAADDSDQGEDEDEDGEMPAGGVIGSTVNSQDLRANQFSQIRKDCSVEEDEFERMVDAEVAGAVAGGTHTDVQSGAPGRGLSQPSDSEPRSQDDDGGGGSRDSRRGGGDAVRVNRNKMRARAQAPGGGGEETPHRGGVELKGATISRTPGAYIRGPATKSSTKKRAVPSHLDSVDGPERSVFDLTSDDDGSDSGSESARRSLKAHPGHQRALDGSTSTSRSKGKNKKKAKNHAGVPTTAQTAALSDNSEGGRGEDSDAVDVRDLQSSDDDDDSHIVRTTQDLKMAEAMAAVRKASTSASAQRYEEDIAVKWGVEEAMGAGREEEEGTRVEDEEGGKRKEAGEGEHAAAHTPSAMGGRGSVSAAGGNPGPESGGSQSGRGLKSCSPELLSFHALYPFLEDEGWIIAKGRGLETWFYLIPGKKGRTGKPGVDYYVSEKEVVQHVYGDEKMLARHEAFCQTTAAADVVARRPASNSTSVRVTAERGEGSRPGGQGSARDPSEASTRRGKRKARGETAAGSSAESGARINAETRPAPVQRQTSGRRRRESEKNNGRRNPGRLAARPRSEGGVDWAQKWRDEWPKLSEEGWHWVYGTGLLTGCIYLKPDVSKADGRLGTDMFFSRQAVLEHVLASASGASASGLSASGASASGAGGPAERDTESESDSENDSENRGVEPQTWQEWSLSRHREPRRKGLTSLEVMKLPGRGLGLKNTRSRPAVAVQGGRSSSIDSSASAPEQGGGQSANRGSDRLQPPAQGRVKRGRGRPHKSPQTGGVPDPTVKRLPVGGSKQPVRELHDDANGEQLQVVENDEESAGENQDERDDDATQPQFELSTAINLAKLGSCQARGASPAASAAAAVFETDGDAGSGEVSRVPSGRPVGDTASLAHPAVGTREGAGRAPEASLTQAPSTSLGKRPRPTRDSPTPSVNGSNGSGGDVTNGVVDRIPNRNPPANSPPNSSCSVEGSGGSNTKTRRSPIVESGVRSSSRRIIAGPFSGLGVIITGLSGDAREKIQASIQKLGGKAVDILDSGASGEWRKLLLNEAALVDAGREREKMVNSGGGRSTVSETGATFSSASTARSRRMIAIATPGSDRTPKFQLAMAAGMPIVHPSYIAACTSMATEVETAGYLLPFGRSALRDRRVIMPHRQARDRPFQGKSVMLCMDGQGVEQTALGNWVFILTVAGATVKLLQEGGGERKGVGVGAGLEVSWSTLEVALDLLKEGHVFCVIGPKRIDGDPVSASSLAVEEAAVQAGTPAGSLEWAVQCMAHGRFLLPNVVTCPWFPLGAAGGGSGGGCSLASSVGTKEKGKGRRGGKRSGRGRGRGRGAASGRKTSGDEVGPFYVHLSAGRRYVAGDYIFLKRAAASNNSGGAAVGTAAVADHPPRVARVKSFRRDAGGNVWVAVISMKRGDGAKVLVASGEEGDDEEEEVGEEMLGARVLALTKREMETTQLYSLSDSGIFCLRD